MDFEQIVKRLQWLDEEHRKEKDAITVLEGRIAGYEGNLDTVAKQVKPLEKQIAGLMPNSTRIDQFEALVARLREELKESIEELDKKYQKREKELLTQRQKDLEPFHKEIEGLIALKRDALMGQMKEIRHGRKALRGYGKPNQDPGGRFFESRG